ncbi:MAG: hypothetical protein AAFV71_24610 [Cyanobacteria bacterium J06633_8]
MKKRCDRNRKRSKRRAIYCPIHNCYIDTLSKKYPLFADTAGQLQQRGLSRRNAMILVKTKTAVSLQGEWLESFWCEECQEKTWYHVRKYENSYQLSVAPPELWQQATGVIHPHGNPSISEFSRKQAKNLGFKYFASI